MSDGLDLTIVGGIAAGVGSILTVVFSFLLKWRAQDKDKKPDSAKKEAAVPAAPAAPAPALTAANMVPTANPSGSGLPATDTGRHRALTDLSSIDWGTLQKHVAELAAQQPVTNKQFDDAIGGVKDSVREVRTEMQDVRADVQRVEKKLDTHIVENGKRHSSQTGYRHVPASGGRGGSGS